MSRHIYGEQPFWFWNGKDINPEGIRSQITAMHNAGVRGFFIHPRQGMGLPYRSNYFLKMIRVAAETAKELGMDMWMYDEYPYPSGYSGGELVIKEEYRAKILQPFQFESEGGKAIVEDLCWGKVLYARGFKMDGDVVDWDNPIDLTDEIGIIYKREVYQLTGSMAAYNRKRFFTGDKCKQLYWEAPEGKYKIFIFIEKEIEVFKYFGTMTDPLNKEAMAEYIETTHERYREAVGDFFGTTIKGIFTDETSPVIGNGIYWSRLLPDIFKERNGYDLIDYLPALLCDMNIDNQKFLYDYNNTVIEAFIDAYDKPVRDWCAKYNLNYTAEKPHLRGNQIAYMHVPGIDNCHQKVGSEPKIYSPSYRSNAKVVASSAHFAHDNRALIEAYHSTGWGVTMRDMRWMIDYVGINGINVITPHAFYYSTDALRKHDAAPSFFDIMPWYEKNQLYASHLDTTTEITLYGQRHAKYLVVDPAIVTYTQRQELDRIFMFLPEGIPIVQIQKAMGANHLDYYVVDTDLLKQISVTDGKVVLKGEEFDAVIVPKMGYMEDDGVKAMDAIVAGGVPVYCVKEKPTRNITTGEAWSFDGDNVKFLPDAAAMVDALVADFGREYSFQVDGKENASILGSLFTLDGVRYLYTENLYREELCVDITVKGADAPVALINTVTKKAVKVASKYEDGAVKCTVRFAPFQCQLIALGIEGEDAFAADAQIALDLGKIRPFTRSRDNVVRLGEWQADLGGNLGKVNPMPVIDQLESIHGKILAMDAYEFGCLKKLIFTPMDLNYKVQFVNNYGGPITLCMEPDSVNGEHEILVNGHNVEKNFVPGFVYNRGNLVCDITPYVLPGKNEIVVNVHATLDHDGLVNPLYLAGDFGCKLISNVYTLVAKKTEGAINTPVKSGLPYYSGKLSYDVTADLAAYAGKKLTVAIPGWEFEDAVELIVDGKSCGSIAWNPFSWDVEVPADLKCAQLVIYNTALPAIEGAFFDFDEHKNVYLQEFIAPEDRQPLPKPPKVIE